MPLASRTRRTQTATATRSTSRTPRRSGGSSSKSSNTWMWWVGGIVVSMLITFAFKLSHKSTDDTQVRKEMIQVVHSFPDYSENSAYYNQLVDRYHHDAFEAAYTMGGRRTLGKLDAKAYLIQISSRMATKAAADGKTSIAQTLQEFHSLISSR